MAAGTTGHLVEKFDTFARAGEEFPVTVTPKWDPDVKMRALQWQGKRKVEVHSVSKPLITDPVSVGMCLWPGGRFAFLVGHAAHRHKHDGA